MATHKQEFYGGFANSLIHIMQVYINTRVYCWFQKGVFMRGYKSVNMIKCSNHAF